MVQSSDSKAHKRTGKKASSGPDKEENICNSVVTSKKEDGNKRKLDAKSASQSGKKVEVMSEQSEDVGGWGGRGQGKGTSSKDLAKTPSKDEAKKPLPTLRKQLRRK